MSGIERPPTWPLGRATIPFDELVASRPVGEAGFFWRTRIDEDRKKPGVAFWATVGLVAVLLYVASFGPAIWVIDHDYLSAAWEVDTFEMLYRPIILIEENGPTPVSDAIDWYIELWHTSEWSRQPDYIGHQLL